MTTILFPGQGAQSKGMGAPLFAAFPDMVARADAVLGYSIERLCLEDPGGDLRRTQYTQPALFVVGALAYLDRRRRGLSDPDFLAGHSLGEFTALFAAGAFDFETGLALVRRRGELMAACGDGGMAAIVGLDEGTVARVLAQAGFDQLDIANINTPSQIVLAGPPAVIEAARPAFTAAGAQAYVVLNVSGAFHSRYMQGARDQLASFLDGLTLADPAIPVVANVTARPYRPGEIRANLARQLCSPVRWCESVRWLWGQGQEAFEEMPPGSVLTGLVRKIRDEGTPLVEAPPPPPPPPAAAPASVSPRAEAAAAGPGGDGFCGHFGVEAAMVAGGLGHGIAGPDWVASLARAGVLAFLGADGMDRDWVRAGVRAVRAAAPGLPFGVNLHRPVREGADEPLVDLLLEEGVDCLEAGGYFAPSRALLRWRFGGGGAQPRRLLVKVTRFDAVEAFLSPPSAELLAAATAEGWLDARAVALAEATPMADAVCVVGDCGGETSRGNLLALLPAALALRQRLAPGCFIGAGGGIGSAAAAAALFGMGADFILCGSLLLATRQAGLSDTSKDMLAAMGPDDVEAAPSDIWFEWGGETLVLKRGTFAATRARRLHDLYRFHESWEQIPSEERRRVEEKCLLRPFAEAVAAVGASALPPKQRMAAVFRSYLTGGLAAAIAGSAERKADFRIPVGPALGVFNDGVRGTPLADWRARDAGALAKGLMEEAAALGRKSGPDRPRITAR